MNVPELAREAGFGPYAVSLARLAVARGKVPAERVSELLDVARGLQRLNDFGSDLAAMAEAVQIVAAGGLDAFPERYLAEGLESARNDQQRRVTTDCAAYLRERRERIREALAVAGGGEGGGAK